MIFSIYKNTGGQFWSGKIVDYAPDNRNGGILSLYPPVFIIYM